LLVAEAKESGTDGGENVPVFLRLIFKNNDYSLSNRLSNVSLILKDYYSTYIVGV
jgi:hypothetical protein